MTYRILTDDSRKIIYRSRIRLVATLDPTLQELDPPVNERFRDNIQDLDPSPNPIEDDNDASLPDLLIRSNDASDPSDDDYMSDRIFQREACYHPKTLTITFHTKIKVRRPLPWNDRSVLRHVTSRQDIRLVLDIRLR